MYTLGRQLPLDSCRWNVISAALHVVRDVALELNSEYGNRCVELVEIDGKVRGIRLLRDESNMNEMDQCWETLKIKIATKVLHNDIHSAQRFPLPPSDFRAQAIKFVLEPECNNNTTTTTTLDMFPEMCRNVLLVLRGLLCYGILRHCLSMRWMVHFGCRQQHHHATSGEWFAVPYRAKNMPAPRADFAHPDVAIGLTVIHYMYAGLQKEHFRSVLLNLMARPDRVFHYNRWLLRTENQASTMSSSSSIDSVNVNSQTQIDGLFETFRNNPFTVEYWLSFFVFPVEAKYFEKKISASAWDLACALETKEVCIGFSGSIDSQYLYPSGVKQFEEPGTSGWIIQTLLERHGSDALVHRLPPSFVESDVLRLLCKTECSVILDASALATNSGISNREFAKSWLLKSPQKDACLFVEETDGIMMVVTKNETVCKLSQSPFLSDLSNCLVFLDQVGVFCL